MNGIVSGYLEHFALRLTQAVAHFLWIGALLAVGVWVTDRLLVRSAAARHGLHLLGMLVLTLTLPVCVVWPIVLAAGPGNANAFDLDHPPAGYEKGVRMANPDHSIKVGGLRFHLSELKRSEEGYLRADLGIADGFEVDGFRLHDLESETKDGALNLSRGHLETMTAEKWNGPPMDALLTVEFAGGEVGLGVPGAERFLLVEDGMNGEDPGKILALLKTAANGQAKIPGHRIVESGGALFHQFSELKPGRTFAFAVKMPSGIPIAGVLEIKEIDWKVETVQIHDRFLPTTAAREVFDKEGKKAPETAVGREHRSREVATGRAVDSETGVAVEKFVIQDRLPMSPKYDGPPVFGGETRSEGGFRDGKFSIRALSTYENGKLVEEGQGECRLVADGYLPEHVVVPADHPGGEVFTVRLRRGNMIRGRVLDHCGIPVAGAGIYLSNGQRVIELTEGPHSEFQEPSVRSDEDGRFEMSGGGGDNQSISGEIVGLPDENVDGVFVYVKPVEASGEPLDEADWKLPTFDGLALDGNGKFTSERIAPGQYKIIATANRTETPGERTPTGLRLPAWVGTAIVTVPETGEPPRVRVEMKPYSAHEKTTKAIPLDDDGNKVSKGDAASRPDDAVSAEPERLNAEEKPLVGIWRRSGTVDSDDNQKGTELMVLAPDRTWILATYSGYSGKEEIPSRFRKIVSGPRWICHEGHLRQYHPAPEGGGEHTYELEILSVTTTTLSIERSRKPELGPVGSTRVSDQAAVEIKKVLSKSEGNENWGEATEGVQVRLRADKTVWKVGEVPGRLLLDVRNLGQVELVFLPFPSGAPVTLDVDGHVYRYTWGNEGWYVPSVVMKPGNERLAAVSVDLLTEPFAGPVHWEDWNEHNKPLTLAPGKHTLRVRWGDKAFSNAVEIEIAPEDPGVPRRHLEDFLAAVAAGRDDRAVKRIHPDKVEQIKELHKLADLKALAVKAVWADARDALGLSSEVAADHDRKGVLVFTLWRAVGCWHINDIDLASPEGSKEKLDQFRTAHPEAKEAPPAPGAGADADADERMAGLQLALACQKPKVELGEDLQLEVTVKNGTAKPIEMDHWGLKQDFPIVTFTWTGEPDRHHVISTKEAPWCGTGRLPTPLEAGSEKKQAFRVGDCWEWGGSRPALLPGNYQVTAKVTRLDRNGHIRVLAESAPLAVEVVKEPVRSEATQPADAKPAEPPWGEPTDGVQVRLRADKVRWKAGEKPTLRADVRNEGAKLLRIWRDQLIRWELEFDGQWYQPPQGTEFTSRPVNLDPGTIVGDISIQLDYGIGGLRAWNNKVDGTPLKLGPGKHKTRVAVWVNGEEGASPGKGIRAVSTSVEIEILSAEAKLAAPAAILPEEAEALARLAKVLASGKFPAAREAARSIGKLKSPAAVDILIEALKHADAQTAMGIGLSLGRIGNPKAIPALLSLFDRDDALKVLATSPMNETLASVAHWSLVRITWGNEDPAVSRREGLAMIPGGGESIKDGAALAAVRDSWRANLAGGATPPAGSNLTPGQEKQRNNLLNKADQNLRQGLSELSRAFPQLAVTNHQPLEAALAQDRAEPGRLGIFLGRGNKPSKTPWKPEEIRDDQTWSVLAVIGPAGGPVSAMGMSPLYPGLGLEGQCHAIAGDPKLDAALKNLLQEALAPLKALDEGAAKSRSAATQPAPEGAAAPPEADKAAFAREMALAEAAGNGPTKVAHRRKALQLASAGADRFRAEYQLAGAIRSAVMDPERQKPEMAEATAMLLRFAARKDVMDYYDRYGVGSPHDPEMMIPTAAVMAAAEMQDAAEGKRLHLLALSWLKQIHERRVQEWQAEPKPPEPAPDSPFEGGEMGRSKWQSRVHAWEQRQQRAKEGKVLSPSETSLIPVAIRGYLERHEPAQRSAARERIAKEFAGTEIAAALGAAAAQPADDVPWGEPAEGVQVRLRADKVRWQAGEIPMFAADARNHGTLQLSGSPLLDYDVQIDGQWFHRQIMTASPQSLEFGPGKEFPDTRISLLGRTLIDQTTDKHLELKPGKHTVRAAFVAHVDTTALGKSIRAVSNPVEIEIAGIGEPSTTLILTGELPRVLREPGKVLIASMVTRYWPGGGRDYSAEEGQMPCPVSELTVVKAESDPPADPPATQPASSPPATQPPEVAEGVFKLNQDFPLTLQAKLDGRPDLLTCKGLCLRENEDEDVLYTMAQMERGAFRQCACAVRVELLDEQNPVSAEAGCEVPGKGGVDRRPGQRARKGGGATASGGQGMDSLADGCGRVRGQLHREGIRIRPGPRRPWGRDAFPPEPSEPNLPATNCPTTIWRSASPTSVRWTTSDRGTRNGNTAARPSMA